MVFSTIPFSCSIYHRSDLEATAKSGCRRVNACSFAIPDREFVLSV